MSWFQSVPTGTAAPSIVSGLPSEKSKDAMGLPKARQLVTYEAQVDLGIWAAHLIETFKLDEKRDLPCLKQASISLEMFRHGGDRLRQIVGVQQKPEMDLVRLKRIFAQRHDYTLYMYHNVSGTINFAETQLHDKAYPWKNFISAMGYINAAAFSQGGGWAHLINLYNFDWRIREYIRCEKLYEKLPWHVALAPIADHFAHIAMTEEGLLAYTPDEAKGKRDVQVRLRPGKYLQQFYPNLTSDQIREWGARVTAAGEVHFAKTGDEVDWVYSNGPTSCMDPRSGMYIKVCPVNPVRVYHNSDLQLAWIEGSHPTTGAKIATARTICWPEKKIYQRPYGDIERLRARMNRRGYTEMGNWCFEGAKIRRIDFTVEHGSPAHAAGYGPGRYLLLPHIDLNGFAPNGGFAQGLRVLDKEWLQIAKDGPQYYGRGPVILAPGIE